LLVERGARNRVEQHFQQHEREQENQRAVITDIPETYPFIEDGQLLAPDLPLVPQPPSTLRAFEETQAAVRSAIRSLSDHQTFFSSCFARLDIPKAIFA